MQTLLQKMAKRKNVSLDGVSLQEQYELYSEAKETAKVYTAIASAVKNNVVGAVETNGGRLQVFVENGEAHGFELTEGSPSVKVKLLRPLLIEAVGATKAEEILNASKSATKSFGTF